LETAINGLIIPKVLGMMTSRCNHCHTTSSLLKHQYIKMVEVLSITVGVTVNLHCTGYPKLISLARARIACKFTPTCYVYVLALQKVELRCRTP
jgi:hypothetical protein